MRTSCAHQLASPAAALPLLQFIRDATAAAVPANGESQAPTYFTQPQLGFVGAAVARPIPTDELGPGAKEAGAAVFINGRLAGGYGRAESWYMQGHGLKVTPAQLYARRAPPVDRALADWTEDCDESTS